MDFPGQPRLADFPELPLSGVSMLRSVDDLGSFWASPMQSRGLLLGTTACEVQEGRSQPPGDDGGLKNNGMAELGESTCKILSWPFSGRFRFPSTQHPGDPRLMLQ